MKEKTTRPTKHADCFTSDTRRSPASVPPVFPFEKTTVTINSVSLTIISTSSVIVDDYERSIFIPPAIKPVHDSVVSATETMIHATFTIVSRLQRTVAVPNTIMDAISAIIFGSQTTVSEAQTIVSVTETIISGEPQNPANEWVADGSREIIISAPETMISVLQTTISVLQTRLSKTKAIIFERMVVIDGPHTIIAEPDSIISGPDSIIDIHEAVMSIVETIVSATETDFPKADTIISAFPRNLSVDRNGPSLPQRKMFRGEEGHLRSCVLLSVYRFANPLGCRIDLPVIGDGYRASFEVPLFRMWTRLFAASTGHAR